MSMNSAKNNAVGIHGDICRIFKETFGEQVFNLKTSIGNIDGWDSLGHMRLILALENKFDIKFDYSEIVELSSVEAIQEFLRKKGKLS